MSTMWHVRPMVPGDISFVMNSWLRRYRDSIHPRLVTDRVYYEFQQGVIQRILATEGLKVVVAVDPEDTNHIYGYCVGEALTDDWMMLHWVYVKGAFRRFSMARDLLNSVVNTSSKIQYSHRTKLVDYLDKNGTAVYVPSYTWAMT
jgi:hypothetical protein